MKNGFIELTTVEYPVIIGIANIASVQPYEKGSIIYLNYSIGEKSLLRVYEVQETFDEIKKMLGLNKAQSGGFKFVK